MSVILVHSNASQNSSVQIQKVLIPVSVTMVTPRILQHLFVMVCFIYLLN